MSTPSAADFLERVVAALAEPTSDPDLTVGQAVWQLYEVGARAWTTLSLRPVGGGREAFDAVYEATRHGLQVLEVQTESRARKRAADDDADEVAVVFAGEVVAIFRAGPGGASARDTVAALAGAAPAIGLLLVELAQRRRMHREIGHLRALARLNEGLWVHRDATSLLDAAAAEFRAGWNLERVRVFARGEGGVWPLVAVAALATSSRTDPDALGRELVMVAEHAHSPAIVRVAPAGWLVPVADDGPPRGALLLDNAITGSPLERADDLAQAVRALAAAWTRLPGSPSSRELWAGGDGVRPAASVIEEAIAPHDGQLVLWRLLGPARHGRRRDRRAADEAGRTLERLVAPRFRFVAASPDSFAALLTGTSLEAARELADSAVDALSISWRLVGSVVAIRGRPAGAAVAAALNLLEAAASLHDGAVLAEADRWQVAPEGGLMIADGAVLHPASHRLDLAHGTVSLTRTEVRILNALSLAGGPLAASELVRRVWPGDRTMGVMNLYPHVHGLRRRLVQAWPGGLRVRTIRGQGYALATEGTVAELA